MDTKLEQRFFYYLEQVFVGGKITFNQTGILCMHIARKVIIIIIINYFLYRNFPRYYLSAQMWPLIDADSSSR